MSLFRGRTDVYARHWEKDGRSGYSPAYEFNWDEFMAHKRRGGSMKDFENKKLIPLTSPYDACAKTVQLSCDSRRLARTAHALTIG